MATASTPEVVVEPIKYTVEEFANRSMALYGYPSECVIAAFKGVALTEATEDDAKLIVEQFMNMEVKN